MVVTAALCWFDEPLWQLEDCIRGLPTVADRVVAVDGGYRRYPGAKAASPPEQAETIQRVAEEAGLECVLHIPRKMWRGQVEKRSFTLQLATEGQNPDEDWFMAVDADHIWSGRRRRIRHELRTASERIDGFEVKMFTPANPDRPIEESAAGAWHAQHAGRYMSPQRIFRAYPGIRVERFHWWYSALKGDQRIWLWGGVGKRGAERRPHARIRPLQAPFLVEHRCLFREPLQIERNRDFCNDRELIVARTGQEDA